MHDVIVIGGGPAGLAAMAYALDRQLDAVLVCARLGGKAGHTQSLVGNDESFALLGGEALDELKRRVTAQAERLITDVVVGVFKRDNIFHVLGERNTFHGHAVIVATGAQPTMLGVPNERQLIGHGLGYSIAAHAQAVAGRSVAIVGSTMRALRGAAELVQIAQQIVLIMPHGGELQSLLGQRLREHPRVHLFEGYKVTEIEASNDTVQAVIVARRGETQRIPVSAVFAALRLVPNVQMVREAAKLDRHGFLVVDQHCRTSLPGLFAAGDMTNTAGEQILSAIGDGVRAAAGAYDYILAQRLQVPATDFLELG